jgi:hypothetical protein
VTLATMRNNILRLVPGMNPTIINSFIQDAYTQLAMKEWNILNITRTLHTIAPASGGKVNVDTQGNVTPAGVDANGNVAIFDPTFVGRWMSIHYLESIFWIDSYTSPSIHLSNWPGTKITGETYSTFKNIYTVSPDLKHVSDVVYNISLEKKSQHFFNQVDPYRSSTGEPTWWALAGWDEQQNVQIEIYPPSDQIYPIRLYGKRKTTNLMDTSTPFLQETLVENYALLQCYRDKMRLEPSGGWKELLTHQVEIYNQLLLDAQDEDYQLGISPDKVKDTQGRVQLPADDTFWASHDYVD